MTSEHYNNFFIGIPIPKNILRERDIFMADLKQKFPYFKLNEIEFPHVTVLFMGKQEKTDVLEIIDVVEKEAGLLKGVVLEIGGFGYFENNFSDVVFLDVRKSESLENLHQILCENLQKYFFSAKENFKPHLTVARIAKKDKIIFSQNLENIKKKFENIKWTFPATTINIYGRDPELKNKLIEIKSLPIF